MTRCITRPSGTCAPTVTAAFARGTALFELYPETRVLQTYFPRRGTRRAVAFEPRNVGGWDRITYERRRGAWVPTGSEIVAQLEIVVGDGASLRREGPPATGP